jgi:hypothetical protein
MVILLVPGCVPIKYGGCLLRSSQYTSTGAASGEGQSSMRQTSFLEKSIGYGVTKVKLIVVIKNRKISNRRQLFRGAAEGATVGSHM